MTDTTKIVNAVSNTARKISGFAYPIVGDDGSFKELATALRLAPDTTKNVWCNTLYDFAVKQVVLNKRAYHSYFRSLRKGTTSSKNLQLMMVNLIKAKNYSIETDADEYFENEIPDVDAQYVSHLDKKKFVQSFSNDNIITALTSAASFDNLIGAMELALFNSMEMYDVAATKATIEGAIENGNVYLYALDKPVNKDTVLDFATKVKTLADDLEKEIGNKYSLNHGDTRTVKEDAFLMLTSDVANVSDVYAYAWMFNRTLAELDKDGLYVKMPSTGLCDGKVFGIYADKDAIQIYDFEGFPRVASRFFEDTLNTKRWLHYWAVYAYDYLVNSIAFCVTDAIGIDTVAIKSRNGSNNANRGEVKKFDVEATFTAGKLGDKFGTFSVEGATDEGTHIDPNSGELIIGKLESGASGKLTVKFVSHLDATKTATLEITINQ